MTSEPRQVPTRIRLGFGSAELGINATEILLRVYLLKFYTDAVGLSPGLAAVAGALALVWDAVTDPWMGHFSDRNVHRFGGRSTWIPIGAAIMGAGVWMLFEPPALADEASRFAWLLGTYVLVNTGMTVISVPHLAITGELTTSPRERAVLFGWRFAFMNIGAVLTTVLVTIAFGDRSGTPEVRREVMGTVGAEIAVVIFASALVCWFSVRRRLHPPRRRTETTPSLVRSITQTLANPTFRPLLGAYVLASVAMGINAAASIFYYKDRLLLSEAQVNQMIVVFISVFTLSLFGWVRLSHHFGKRRPLVWGTFVLGSCISTFYLVFPPGNFLLPLLVGGVFLGSLVGCIVLIDATVTDVIDYEKVRTGEDRGATYFGVWRFGSKLARAGAFLFTGLVLDAVGYDPERPLAAAAEEPVSDAVSWALALLFGPGVGLCLLAAGVILARYRFTHEKQQQVQRILARRKSA